MGAFTVLGIQHGRAMMTGRKQIENRKWKIPVGWYALHVTAYQRAPSSFWCERMKKVWPDAPPEESSGGNKIVGLVHVNDHRTPSECLDEENNQSVWAIGPICHIIDQAIMLERPVQHRGANRLWKISERRREQLVRRIKQQW